MNTELCLLWVPRLRRYHGCGCLVWGENFLDAGASHLGVSRSNVFYWGGGVLFVYLRVPIAYHVFFAPGAPIAYHVFFAPAAQRVSLERQSLSLRVRKHMDSESEG